jgi:hypothetical protein
VAAMRTLLAAAVGVAAAVFHSAAATPHVETLNTVRGHVAAFAQDGDVVAWFAPGSGTGCNSVTVASVANPIKVQLPQQGSAQNVTCMWRVGTTPVNLALAGTNVAWTLHQESPIPFDWLLGAGASVGNRKERRFQELAHTKRGVGIWLGGVSGDRSTLVYGIANVDYVDEAGCLSGTGSCELETAGGGVYRLMGRQLPKLIPGTDAAGAVAVAASDGAVAYIPSASVARDGRPAAGADLPIEIVDAATGASIARVMPQGVPLAIALTPTYLATLERTAPGLRIAWYDRATGDAHGSTPVPPATSPDLSATDSVAVFHVGRSIRSIAPGSAKPRTLVRAAADPLGLSIEGRRIAWAENLKSTARIRALTLTP